MPSASIWVSAMGAAVVLNHQGCCEMTQEWGHSFSKSKAEYTHARFFPNHTDTSGLITVWAQLARYIVNNLFEG